MTGKQRSVMVATLAVSAAAIVGITMVRSCKPPSGTPVSAVLGHDATGRVTMGLLDQIGRGPRMIVLDAANGHVLRDHAGVLGDGTAKTACRAVDRALVDDATGTPIAIGTDVIQLSGTGLVRVDFTGDKAQGKWMVKLAGPCQVATVVDGVLAIGVADPHQRAIGIDLQTGEVTWTLSL